MGCTDSYDKPTYDKWIFQMDRPAVLKNDENGVLDIPGNEWAEFKLGSPGVIKKVHYNLYNFILSSINCTIAYVCCIIVIFYVDVLGSSL